MAFPSWCSATGGRAGSDPSLSPGRGVRGGSGGSRLPVTGSHPHRGTPAPPAGAVGRSGSSAGVPPVSSPSSPGAGPPGRVLPSFTSHRFFGRAFSASFRAMKSRRYCSHATSYSSQFDTPNSSNGCRPGERSGSAVAGSAPAGRLPRWRSTVMNRRKNHPAASRAVRSSSDRRCRRRVNAASANPSRMTSRRAVLIASRHPAGSASGHPRTAAASSPSLRATCSQVEPPARSSAAAASRSADGPVVWAAAGDMTGLGTGEETGGRYVPTCSLHCENDMSTRIPEKVPSAARHAGGVPEVARTTCPLPHFGVR